MAIRDLFELVDFEENEVKTSPVKQHFKKIKFKEISRTNISLHWQKFRLKRLREKLATMKVRESELEDGGINDVSKKIMKKAEKIADLEAKITFIETGKKSKVSFINSRALNLKKLMMENLVSNGEYIYSVPSSIADKIRRGEYEQKDEEEKVIENISSFEIPEESSESVDPELQRELAEAIAASQAAEKKANEEAYQSQQPEYIPSPISKEEVEKSIKANLEASTPITREEVAEKVSGELDTIELGSEVTKESIRAAIKSEMEKIDLDEKNDETPELVEEKKAVSVINEDGSYRLRREDIDDEIRINYFDRSLLDEPVKDLEMVPVSEVTPFADIKVQKPGEVPTPKITGEYGKETAQTTAITVRETPIIVPTRESETIEKKESEIVESTSVENEGTSNSDIETILAKIEILKKERARIEIAKQKETEQLVDTKATLEKTKAKLVSYADSLEAKCNGEKATVESLKAEREATESEINAALAIMGMEEITPADEKPMGRAK